MGKRSREKREIREGDGIPEKKEKFLFQTGFEKACLLIVRWGTYLLLFTPLVVNSNFFFPFVSPKTIFFRIIAEVIFTAYVFLLLINKRYRPNFNILTKALIVFLGIYILTSFTGINLERSFWSTFERMTGIWTMLHLVALYFVLTGVFKQKKDWEKLLLVVIIVGVWLSLNVLMGQGLSTRGGGTIGNTSFMATFLAFPLFFSLILFLNKFGKSWGWMIFSGASFVVMCFAFFNSTARGAIFAFWAGIFLLIFGYIMFFAKKSLKMGAIFLALLLIIFSSVVFIMKPEFARIEVDGFFYEMNSRFTVWQMAWHGWRERFWLGWGPENFNAVFSQNFNPCLFLSKCGGEIWFDRAHNIILDIGTTTGISGLLSYLALLGVSFYGLLRTSSKIIKKRNIFLPLGIAVMLTVYFIENLLVFDMINTYLMFFLCLALTSFLAFPAKESGEETKNRSVGLFPSILIIGVAGVVFWTGNIQPAQSSMYITEMVNPYLTIEESIDFYEKATKSYMIDYEATEQFSRRTAQAANSAGQSRESAIKGFDFAISELKKSVAKNPLDFRPAFFLGKMYLDFYILNGDNANLDLSKELLEKATELSPKNQQTYWTLAQVRLYQGYPEETIKLFQKTVELEPEFGQSYWYLALAYNVVGQYDLARIKVIEAEKYNYSWRNNLSDLKRVIEIYEDLKDYNGLVPLYKEAINKEPQNVSLWGSLALTYAYVGDKERAREAALKVSQIDPAYATHTSEFLKILEKGQEYKDFSF